MSTDNPRALAAHSADCDDCGTEALPVDRLGALLASSVIDLDTGPLSQRVFGRLQPELYRHARRAYWRRVIVGFLLALLPLPAVLAYDAYVLSLAYRIASTLLPKLFAAYLVLSYAALLALLFAVTYAAIPLLVERATGPRPAALPA